MTYSTSVRLHDFHPATQEFFKNKKVVVTGGTGFIGSHLVEQLLQLKAFPIVLTRQAHPHFLADILSQVVVRKCDLFDYSDVSLGVSDSDVVIHLAAVVGGLEYNKKHPASIFHHNMQMFLNVVRAVKERTIPPLLSVCSSACVYPRYCTIPTPEIEGFKDEPEPTNSGYGWAKRMQEYLAQKYVEEFGLHIAIPRPYNAYGPRDNFDLESSHVIPALIRKALETQNDYFEVWGDGRHSRSFVYVDDFARGILEVTARYHIADPINIGANEEVTIFGLAEKIAKLSSDYRQRTIVPKFNTKGLTGQPRRCCSIDKLNRELGFGTKIAIDVGLKNTFEWYINYENSAMHSHSQ
ncbi:GDP-L-fucose synthase [Gammaproteobacteria bacterium]